MVFSTEFWPFTLLGAAIAATVAWVLVKLGGGEQGAKKEGKRDTLAGAAALLSFVTSLVVLRGMMYYQMPVFQGAFWGYSSVVVVVMLPAAFFALMIGGIGSVNKGRVVVPAVCTLLVIFGWPIAKYMYEAVGPHNRIRFAALANIKVAGKDEKIPPSNPSQLVMVSQRIAHFKGQSVLGSLGSKYELKEESYTLQSVGGHRYWVAPLTLHNFGDTLNLDNPESPGYVVVDAENPEVDPILKDGFHIKLFPDQKWGLFLQRYIYTEGFKERIIDRPYFEVDDNWQPYWVAAYVKQPFGGVAGKVVEKAIVINVAQVEPKIEVFDPSDPEQRKKFAWVDRVVTRDLVLEYARDWGKWSGEFAHEHPWKVWFGFDKTGTKKPDDAELCYTTEGENVWVLPMTSVVETDHACLGILVMETNRNEGKFYSGLQGFNVGSSVSQTMEQARDNMKHYPVGHIQIMSIYGELTWVAIYEAKQTIGASFGGIGLLHAHSQNAADVIFATDKASALRRYQTQLAGRKFGSEKVSRTVTPGKEVSGKVLRISPAISQGVLDAQGSVFQVRLAGETAHVFMVSKDVYTQIGLVRDGDEVTLTYVDPVEDTGSGIKEVPVKTFQCKLLGN